MTYAQVEKIFMMLENAGILRLDEILEIEDGGLPFWRVRVVPPTDDAEFSSGELAFAFYVDREV